MKYQYTIADKLHGSVDLGMTEEEWECLPEHQKHQVIMSLIMEDLNIKYEKINA